MSEHATHYIHFLKHMEPKVDPSLLLLLAASKQTISNNECTAYLDSTYTSMFLEPFCEALMEIMGPLGTEAVRTGLVDYCRAKSSDFLKSTSQTLAGLESIYKPCIADNDEVMSEMEGEIRLNRPNFELFLKTVSEYFQEMIPGVTPQRYVCACCKDPTIQQYEEKRAEWGVHNPFMFQTYDMALDKRGKPMIKKGTSVFFIFRTASDGIRAVADFLKEGQTVVDIEWQPKEGQADTTAQKRKRKSKLVFKVMGVNELTLPGMLCNFVLDCEASVSFYGGHLSSEAIEQSMDRFLSKLLGAWAAMGVIQPDCFTGVAIKNKSRPLPGDDYKVSRHCVPYIIATPELHQAAQTQFLSWRDGSGCTQKELIDKAKGIGTLPKDYRLSDTEFWDYSAMCNGMAILGSTKRISDEPAKFEGARVFLGDTEVQREECDIPLPHSPNALSPRDYHQVLWQLCATTPKYITEEVYPISYTDDFVRKEVA